MANKKNMRDKAKEIWLKGMKAVGNTAASIANNTRYKVDEVTIQNRRREVLNDLAHKVYALWLKGEGDMFPEPVTRMLEELKQLDEQLNDMRAEKYASSRKYAGTAPENAGENAADEDETEEEPEIDSPVSAEINSLFDSTPSVGRTAEKVNQSLDQLSERIRSFPQSPSDDAEQRQE